ncbi:MAG: UXX-star (seleno)protein family 1 [Pseudomonadota bacterium]
MSDHIIIYGKDSCPFTRAARDAYSKMDKTVEYINVLDNEHRLQEMLQLSKGSRQVPVIVEGDKVTIGFQGRA